VREVTLKFRVPQFDHKATKWTRETLEQVQDELSMFDYTKTATPWSLLLFQDGKRVGKLSITEGRKKKKP
jgi:hypothetical protein